MTDFALLETTIQDLQAGMGDGRFTARVLVEQYLARIQLLDPQVNAIIELNPDALAIADALDQERAAQGPRSLLHGIPIILKDNIDTADALQTTAGSLALAGSIAPQDAFLITQLRTAGAIILGKANLSEWANFRSTRSSSGWSSRGGQTRNPYALDRSPCGSSSGSAAAVTANFCAAAIGTETDGSIVCPSHANGIVGIKPTLGLVSRSGVIPIAHSQDTAGPMARTVADAAILLGAITGADPRDPETAVSPHPAATNYTPFLDKNGLQGARIGVARNFFGHHPDVDALMEQAIAAMKAQGAEIVDPADLDSLQGFSQSEVMVLLYEFKADLNAYLATLGPDAPVKTMADVIAFNAANPAVMPYFGQERMLAAQEKGPLTESAYLEALADNRRQARQEGIDKALQTHRLDAIIAPSGGPAWPIDWVNGDHHGGGSSSPAAVAGYPSITVPMGFVHGLPVGISFIGGQYQEGVLIRLAYAFEQAVQARRPPKFEPTAPFAVPEKRPFPSALLNVLALLLLVLITACQGISPAQDAATGDDPTPMPPPTLSAQAVAPETSTNQPNDGSETRPSTLPVGPISPETAGRLTAVNRFGDDQATEVVVDPSGRYLGVITTIGLYVYDKADWSLIDFLPIDEPIHSAAFTQDARHLAVADWGSSQIALWEFGSDQPPSSLDGNGEPGAQVVFTPAGLLVSSTASQIVNQDWQNAAAPVSLIAAPDNGRLGRASWSANGEIIAVPVQTQSGYEIMVLPTDGSQPMPALRSLAGMVVEHGRLSPDGAYYAAIVTDPTLQRDNALLIWQIDTPDARYQVPVGQFVAETNWGFATDSRSLAVTTLAEQIEIIQLDSGQSTAALPIARAVASATELKIIFDGQHIVVALADGSLNVWKATEMGLDRFLVDSRVPLTDLQFLTEQDQFITTDQSGLVETRRLPDGRLLQAISNHVASDITDAVFAPDSATVAVSLAGGGIQIWNMGGELQRTITGPAGKVDAVAYSPDGRFLASGLGERIGPTAFDDTVDIWQMPEGGLHTSLGGEKEDAPGCSFFRNSLAFSSDGQYLASASHDFTVGLWQVSDGALVHNFPAHTDSVLDVALSPDGQYLASASEDATIRLWRLSDFQLVHELTGSVGGFWTISFSPDGRFLAGGDMLGRIYLWDMASGELLRVFEGEKYKQSDLAFSADGRLLAAGANGEAIQLWQVDTGQMVGTLDGHSGIVRRVAFSPDGLSLISVGQDNVLRLWQVQS